MTARPHLCALGAVAASLAACTHDHYTVVTVTAPPAVRGATALSVSLANAGTTRMDSLPLGDKPFPLTFSVQTPGRAGDLGIAIDAIDGAGLVVGHGEVMTTTAADAASVALDTTDFVVNTEYAGDQLTPDDFEAAGFQAAALADGTWTAVFRDGCMASVCNVFGRRFDATGKPIVSALAAGTNQFTLTTTPTSTATAPAVAASGTATVAVWDAHPATPALTNIACRGLDASGQATGNQLAVISESADVVSAAPVGAGFAIAWNTVIGADNIVRAAIVKPDCTTLSAAQSLSPAGVSSRRAAVAGSTDRALYTWITGNELHMRVLGANGAPLTADTVLAAKTATDGVEYARAIAVPGGFAVAARWAKLAGAGAGRIDLYRVSSAGAVQGQPTLVTDQSDSDFLSAQSFGIASQPDGTVLVVWHTCGTTLGDGSMCGVFGRYLGSNGAPLSDRFVVPTTTLGDQTVPSVTALPGAFAVLWTDASAKPPDTAGSAVRARIIYPPAR